ncbi:small acid-soluble spore protein Tlp [Bacillus sp. REN10]|uniref:small acid-soluble spore protein Tlp n=1 Tax=Bacillus sp. REN10 TaxID=2782541 RepID=UPI001EEE9324|nr:small acid-soluble spore protein Tlp [Bacillus sp. REN10]
MSHSNEDQMKKNTAKNIVKANERAYKIADMERMINNTVDNIHEANESLDHAESAAQIEKIKENNARRKESIEGFKREIEEERSFL